jgi:SSS family solute:Na+ symporter
MERALRLSGLDLAVVAVYLMGIVGLGLLAWRKRRAKTGWNVPSMMATFYLFVVCSLILAVISYLKPHVHTAESEALVWKNPLAAIKDAPWTGLFDYRVIAGVLIAAMIVLYVIFA